MQYQFKHAEHSNLTKVQHQELISEKSGITLSGKCMNPADDTDGDLLASALKGNKSDFFYKYHSAGPKAYKEASLATKAKDGSGEDIVGHLEYYKKEDVEGGQKYTHVGTAYIKQSDVSTPIRKMSEGETIQVIPTSVEPTAAGKMSVEELKEGFDKDNGECPMKTDVPPGILMTNVVKDGVVGSIAKGTPYQWVHPGGWVYKMGKDDFYYTGLKAIGWKNTDKSLKDSISAINNISGGGRKRRRKTKRKRTKRRKTKRKRTKRVKTKRKKRRGRKKTRR
jgi:hypothetical protein